MYGLDTNKRNSSVPCVLKRQPVTFTFLTPHIAGSFGDETHRMAEYMIEEYELYSKGKQTRYEVTEKMLETMA